MRVVAKTKDGVLIQATEEEVKQIVRSVTGSQLDDVSIGQGIPAIDYSSTVTKVKSLANNRLLDVLKTSVFRFNETFGKLVDDINKAANIDSDAEAIT